jgi:IMP dehydrogenase
MNEIPFLAAASKDGRGVYNVEVVVGGNKRARRSYGFDEVALVPGPLVIDPRDVDVSFELGGKRFAVPILAAALDAAVNPPLAALMSELGGLAVLNLDGVQTATRTPKSFCRNSPTPRRTRV